MGPPRPHPRELLEGNSHGRAGPRTVHVTRALVKNTWARRRSKCRTKRHAKSPVKMPQHARASPSLTAGGAAISALSARQGTRISRRSPHAWIRDNLLHGGDF